VKNGGFEEDTLGPWNVPADRQLQCDTYVHVGYELWGYQSIEMATITGDPIESRCVMTQGITVDTGHIEYAELTWLDRIFDMVPPQGDRGERVTGKSSKETKVIYSEDTSNRDIYMGTYKHIRDVTDFVRDNRAFDLEFESYTNPGAQIMDWDNVQLTVCFDVVDGNDPHFTTWKGEKFSYHGACDLVLLHSDTFGNGLGMDIHIRTKHRRNFSYISHLALRMGDEVLEVAGKGQYYLNGIENAPLPNEIAGYKITHSMSHKKNGYPWYTIHLDDNERIVIKTWKDIVSILFEGQSESNYGDAVGLMGSYHTGEKLGRDGVTVFGNGYNAFGQEWQVLANEPRLFQTLEAGQMQCTLPHEQPEQQKKHRRRLGESISEEAAKKACEHAGAEDLEFCMFDVISTGDIEIAGSY
jgi:hypothetical protein